MKDRRARIDRALLRVPVAGEPEPGSIMIPRRVGPRLIDFSTLALPQDVSRALADAFWNQVDVRAEETILGYWHGIKTFARFVAETKAVGGLDDVDSLMLTRYIEWLNRQVGEDGTPLRTATRACSFYTLKTLLRWLQRCRPHLLGEIVFPQRVFPGKEAAKRRRPPLPPQAVRSILRACNAEISEVRARREQGRNALAAARASGEHSVKTLGGLLLYFEQQHGGIAPPALALESRVRQASDALGGYRAIEPCVYPRPESLFPYYLAVLIHTAGNPEAMARLSLDCLQPVPLLDDRELLVWSKGRAGRLQQRAFRKTETFEPPALVREVTQWTQRLRSHAAPAHRNRLFIAKGHLGVRPFSPKLLKTLRGAFITRHDLPRFTLNGLRSSVLTAFYRASGNLRQVKEIANHAHISTTEGYVRGAEVENQHRVRVAALQSAFLGHLEAARTHSGDADPAAPQHPSPSVPPGTAVSMFGFSCKDPLAGIAPGTRPGEICSHFLGCFTCPNAIITPEPASIARLLKARDHLRVASAYLHPARWETIYAPLLKILEEDILTRFSAGELEGATPLCRSLPPIPELR